MVGLCALPTRACHPTGLVNRRLSLPPRLRAGRIFPAARPDHMTLLPLQPQAGLVTPNTGDGCLRLLPPGSWRLGPRFRTSSVACSLLPSVFKPRRVAGYHPCGSVPAPAGAVPEHRMPSGSHTLPHTHGLGFWMGGTGDTPPPRTYTPPNRAFFT